VRKYTITMKFESHGPDDFNEAREDFNAMGLQIEDTFDLQSMGMDVQQHPKQQPTKAELEEMTREELESLPVDVQDLDDFGAAKHYGLIPKADAIHPWDQGSWIFPEDHPMHVYERMAKRDYDSAAGSAEQREPIKQAFLELNP